MVAIVAEQKQLTEKAATVQRDQQRIENAIRILRGEGIPIAKPQGSEPSTRRPMSDEAKARIRAGILAAAAKKREAAIPTDAREGTGAGRSYRYQPRTEDGKSSKKGAAK